MRIKFIQNIIDKLRNKNVSTPEYFSTMYYKLETIKTIRNIKTLILGSSHGEYGFITTNADEYNCAMSYQDLYYTYYLYKKFNNAYLKNIVIFYSVFSPGYQLIRTKQNFICCEYKVLANIDYQDETIIDKVEIEKIEKSCIFSLKNMRKYYKINKSDRGNCKNYIFPCKTDIVQERTIPHYKNNRRDNYQNQYLGFLIEDAKKNNQNVIIVLSPATLDYKNQLPCSKELFKELYKLIENDSYKRLTILNLYDTDFEPDLFGDWDHPNKKGAKKISKIIEDLL